MQQQTFIFRWQFTMWLMSVRLQKKLRGKLVFNYLKGIPKYYLSRKENETLSDLMAIQIWFLAKKVSVPSDIIGLDNDINIVNVRCVPCAKILSVNMGAHLLRTLPHDLQDDFQTYSIRSQDQNGLLEYRLPSLFKGDTPMFYSLHNDDQRSMSPIISPPEKRQRVPSAYNKFIKEEIQRIKANNPNITHREAFSAAAKNWAHFPHIHFGLSINGDEQVKLHQDAVSAPNNK